jgi:hypothetical protein
VGAAALAAEAKAKAAVDPWAHVGSGHSLRSAALRGSAAGGNGAAGRGDDAGDDALARALSLSAGGSFGDVGDDAGADGDGDDALAAAIALSMAEAEAPEAATAAALALTAEPGPDEPGPFARLQLQGGGLPGKLVRRFRAHDPAALAFAWADACLKDAAGSSSSSSSSSSAAAALAHGYTLGFGRDRLTRAALADGQMSLEAAGLTPSAALTVRLA